MELTKSRRLLQCTVILTDMELFAQQTLILASVQSDTLALLGQMQMAAMTVSMSETSHGS